MKALGFALALAASSLCAQVSPLPGPGDPRLQTVLYNPDQITRLQVAHGYTLIVSFLPGEKIETIALGDSEGWQVTANKRGDCLFVRTNGGAATNMTVVTDVRSYVFDLMAAGAGSIFPYTVRFVDPEPPARPAFALQEPQATYRYKLSGAKALRPSSITIEGDRLRIEWPAKVSLPAVFQIEQDGEETLINGVMRDGRLVIDGTPRRLVFRIDRLTATATRVPLRVRKT